MYNYVCPCNISLSMVCRRIFLSNPFPKSLITYTTNKRMKIYLFILNQELINNIVRIYKKF